MATMSTIDHRKDKHDSYQTGRTLHDHITRLLYLFIVLTVSVLAYIAPVLYNCSPVIC